MANKLIIKDLVASVDGKIILKGLNLEVEDNETLALLGPNGHGKSTLFNVIMGHPRYKVESGSITYKNKDLLTLSTDERAKLGLFLAMQNPPEVPGVNTIDFLRSAVNSREEKPVSTYKFYKIVNSNTDKAKIPFEMVSRSLNEGFSGGEKKRNEILQMMMLNPNIAMLDEIDSGLDVDAIQIVADIINEYKAKGMAFMVISHYARLFNLIQPTRAVVIIDGKIALDGGFEIIEKIDKEGYEFLRKEYGINIEKEEKTPSSVSLGSCAVKETIK